MASISESGHAKNTTNFDELISSVNGYGVTYNPSKVSIRLTALQALSTSSKAAINAVNSALPAYANAVSAREAGFAPLSKLITRVINSLKASGATTQVIDSAKTFARKIQGGRASAKLSETEKQAKAAAGKEVKEISASQMSYDNRLDNFDKLIKLLASNVIYAPNEVDLRVVSLTTLYNDLRTRNTAVITALTPLSNARISRNDVLYKNGSGLYYAATDVKAYVKSLFGASSPQYKQISGIKFTRPR